MKQQNKNKTLKILFIVITLEYVLTILVFIIYLWLKKQLLTDSPITSYWLTIIAEVMMYLLTFWAIRRENISPKSIGWSWHHLKESIKLLIPIWIVTSVITVFILSYRFGYSLDILFQSSFKSVFKHWLFVGPAEELLYRGYIFTKLKQFFQQKYQKTTKAILLAMIIESFLFAISHIPQRIVIEKIPVFSIKMAHNLFKVFLVAITSSWLFYRSQNVIFVGLIHGWLNAPLVGTINNPTHGTIIWVLSIILIEIKIRTSKRKLYTKT